MVLAIAPLSDSGVLPGGAVPSKTDFRPHVSKQAIFMGSHTIRSVLAVCERLGDLEFQSKDHVPMPAAGCRVHPCCQSHWVL